MKKHPNPIPLFALWDYQDIYPGPVDFAKLIKYMVNVQGINELEARRFVKNCPSLGRRSAASTKQDF